MKSIFKLAAYSAVLVSIFACNKISEPFTITYDTALTWLAE